MNEEYAIREYYIYKLFQIISPYGFNVRLCRIVYEDIDGKFKPNPHYGFIIDYDLMSMSKHQPFRLF